MKHFASLLLPAALAINLTAGSMIAVAARPRTPSPAAKPSPALSASYAKIPMSFESNQGQADASVQFLSRGPGYRLALEPGGASFALHPAVKPGTPEVGNPAPATQLSLRLVGANAHAVAAHEDQQMTRTNYLIGNDPTRWHTNVPNYGRVRYSSVYPGIDLVYYGNQHQLEHDFVVAPQADPAQIALAFDIEGGAKLRIDPKTGDLILSTGSEANLRLLAPVTYQNIKSRRTTIPSSYKLLADNRVSFEVGPYNHARPLIIDPVLVYSTYLGGNGGDSGFIYSEKGNSIAVDASGNAYVVGTTRSTDFPTTNGAFETTFTNPSDHGTVFVSKLNATGTALVFSTYLGGSGGDSGYGIALDSSNNVYVTGVTQSRDFPVTCGALQTAPGEASASTTAFVTKLNPSGSALEYSTYLGGTGSSFGGYLLGDAAEAIAVRGSNAYVTGYTFSTDFPVTAGAFQSAKKGTAAVSDVFVTELNGAGTGLVYSTYLGGSNGNVGQSSGFGDAGNTIALDAAGNAFVAGITYSYDFPVTSGAVQTAPEYDQVGQATGFVTELNHGGTAEIYSTYLGGSNGDAVESIAVDSSDNAYVVGNTNSFDFPNTGNVLEPAYDWPNGPTAFAAKINPSGSALVYSTYLEGMGTIASGLAIDSSGAAYIVGSAPTASAGTEFNFVTTPDALATPVSGQSAYVVKLDPSATVLNYATLFGGSSYDGAVAVALDASGNAYVTGFAFSTNFPVSSGAFQTSDIALGGNSTPFIAKFALGAEANQTAYPAPAMVPTSMTAGYSETTCDTQENFTSLTANVTLDAGSDATGTIDFQIDDSNDGYLDDGLTYVNGGGAYQLNGSGRYPNCDEVSFYSAWTAVYSGDAKYQSSSVSGAFTYVPSSNGHQVGVAERGVTNGSPVTIRPQLRSSGSASSPVITSSAPRPFFSRFGAKFKPEPVTPGNETTGLRSSVTPAVAGCIAPVATPMFTPVAGTYTASLSVTITDATAGAAIYFTTDGSTPTTSSMLYESAISVASASETIKAIAVKANLLPSAVGQATFAIRPPAATPKLSLAPGTYTTTQSVTITDATPATTLYYTTDGSTPTNTSTRYTGAIKVATSETLQAIAYGAGLSGSAVAKAIYTINLPATAAPVFSPAAGTYTTAQKVTITDATAGATIYYTTDGTTPSTSSSRYTAAISVAASETIRAFATVAQHRNSPVSTGVFAIKPAAATPVFSLAPGTYTGKQTVTISDTTPGTLYYTLDGTTPSNTSTRYTGAITVHSTETINAVDYASGFSASAVAEATYTIQ